MWRVSVRGAPLRLLLYLVVTIMQCCWRSKAMIPWTQAFSAQLRRPWEASTTATSSTTTNERSSAGCDVIVQLARKGHFFGRRQLHHPLYRRRPSQTSTTTTVLLLSMDQPEEDAEEETTEVYNSTTPLSSSTLSSLTQQTASSFDSTSSSSSYYGTIKPDNSGRRRPGRRKNEADVVEPLFVNGAQYEAAPNVRNSLGPLLRLTRPENFPGIVLFHMLGSYLSLPDGVTYWSTLLRQPAMWITLASLILTSATSMVVNDYYDAKLGRDRHKHKALVDGDIPLHVARRFLSYLYALALVCVAFLPGIPTRLTVIIGLMLTYFYTQHLKPITWLKNIVCSSLIALSPLTSGSAAMHLHLAQQQSLNYHWASSLQVFTIGPLWRLASTLFFGILGREIMMDCNDCENDQQAGVRTVPVVRGRRFASLAALMSSVFAALSAVSGPLVLLVQQQKQLATFEAVRTAVVAVAVPARRLALATVGSAMVLRRGWQVYRSQGGDKEIIDRAVNEGLVTVLFFLASFI